ncbi:MAG TPA: hypothetical protein VHS06_05205 [Chloroflexota bacterium]|nr:hypothetical protein [Chloroflexota bacterium]
MGNGIAIVTNAGGPGIMASDAAERLGMKIAHLTPEITEKLQAALPPSASAPVWEEIAREPAAVVPDLMIRTGFCLVTLRAVSMNFWPLVMPSR